MKNTNKREISLHCVIEKRNSEEENNESERGTYESRGGN